MLLSLFYSDSINVYYLFINGRGIMVYKFQENPQVPQGFEVPKLQATEWKIECSLLVMFHV